MKTTRYNDGTPIPNVTDNTEWRHCDSPAYVWYGNDISYKEPYGALYNWHAVGDKPGLCPKGWHVPSDEEWKILEMYLRLPPSQVRHIVILQQEMPEYAEILPVKKSSALQSAV